MEKLQLITCNGQLTMITYNGKIAIDNLQWIIDNL